jgi:ParB family transcriptional regulator, chromosome partitioning protein
MSTNRKDTRKDTLRELLNPSKDGPPANPGSDQLIEPPNTERIGSSTVRVMGLSLQRLSADAETGRTLRAQLNSGSNVVEVDPDFIEPSFVSDRFAQTDDQAFQDLVKSIETHGQQVPILVRPHPDKSDRYQIAYGHRRLRACIILHQKIRAVVRHMSNTELVVAQGKENSERRDLSFIERALFAHNLEEAGFDRNTLIAALSVDKTEVARLLAVARAIPSEVAYAIGPAPKAGRPRWMALAHLFGHKDSHLATEKLLADADFRKADTDARFAKLFTALSCQAAAKHEGETWRDPTGRPVVRIERVKARTRFIFDERLAPQFGSFVTKKLDELYADFSTRGPDP